MSKYIYGLDLSLTNSGIAILNQDYEPVHITSVKTKKTKGITDEEDHNKRLKIITDKFDECTNQYPVDVVAIEAPFVRHNKATKAVMKVHGVTQRWFNEYPQFYYAPTTVKAAIISGSASKEVLRNRLHKRFPNIEIKNEDESDALAIAITHGVKTKKIKFKKN